MAEQIKRFTDAGEVLETLEDEKADSTETEDYTGSFMPVYFMIGAGTLTLWFIIAAIAYVITHV